MKSSTRLAKSMPSRSAIVRPMRFRQASFMPTSPIVEKWFFQ